MRFFRVLLPVAVFALAATAQPPEAKKPADPKGVPGGVPVVKLPDGTYLWSASPDSASEVVTLPLRELQKAQEQVEQLKKQLSAHKPLTPAKCAIHGRIEKQGEQLVAVLKLTYSFRTLAPRTPVALGGRKGLAVGSSLDSRPLLLLDTAEDGFVASIESAGDHTLVLELNAAVGPRGGSPKTELGFEIGLPRSAITTLLFDAPRGDVKALTLTTRTPDPAAAARPPEPRRQAVDIKQLAARPGHEAGYPLGPVDSLEVSWDPPAAALQAIDQVQAAALDVTVLFTEAAVETTARIKLTGPAREWRIIAPAVAEVSVEPAAGNTEPGTSSLPTFTKPDDTNKPVWKVGLPPGSPASDWVVTAVVRQLRPAPEAPTHRGPFPIGPFAVLDIQRQTGTVQVRAGPNTRFAFKHGVDLRQIPVTAPVEDNVSAAAFRLNTGPTGSSVPNQPPPLLTIEASPYVGTVVVKPAYKLTLEKPTGPWIIQAEVQVSPLHTTVDAIPIEVPPEWTDIRVIAPASVTSEVRGRPDGFWASLQAKVRHGGRVVAVLKLPEGKKQPFDLVLTARLPIAAGAGETTVFLPRFPAAEEHDSAVSIAVPEGQEVRHAEAFDSAGDSANGPGFALAPVQPPNGKPQKVVTAVAVSRPSPISRVGVAWAAAVPDLSVEITATVILGERQLDIVQHIKLKSMDGLPKTVRFRPRHDRPIAGLKEKVVPSSAQFQRVAANEAVLTFPADAKEAALDLSYAVPLDRRPTDGSTWQLPVGLLWPVGVSHVEATVRVWTNTATARGIVPMPGNWRELPADPIPERDSLPVLSLFGSGGDLPLVLEVHEVRVPSAVAVWIDRALVQVWVSEDGSTRYSARFLLRRGSGPAFEARLPAGTIDSGVEVYRDAVRVKDPFLAESGERAIKVPLDPFSQKPVVVEVRYQLPPGTDDRCLPPTVPNAAFAGPVRWQVATPPGTVSLLLAGGSPELPWRWRLSGYAPAPGRPAKELESWFKVGDDPPAGEEYATPAGDSLTVRQATLSPLSVRRASRTGFIVLGSVLVFLIALAVSRLPVAWVGPAIAMVSLAAGVAAILWPQPMAQAAGAGQLGLVAIALLWLLSAAVRSYHRRRIAHLPGFTRIAPEPSVVVSLPSTARSRQSSGRGSASAVPVAPGG